MKTLLTFIALLFCLVVFCPNVQAQEFDPEKAQKEADEKALRDAEFIVEATGYRIDYFYDEHTDQYFSSGSGMINKILRGGDKLKYGTIASFTKLTRENIILTKKRIIRLIPKNDQATGILFCKRADSSIPRPSDIVTDNDIGLEVIRSIGVRPTASRDYEDWQVIGGIAGRGFDNVGELYKYLKKKANVTIPEGNNQYEIDVDSLQNLKQGGSLFPQNHCLYTLPFNPTYA